MAPKWYLVKRNWPHSKVQKAFPLFAGLSGDFWPFDLSAGSVDSELKILHARMESSRTYVDFGDVKEMLCTDAIIARQYFAAVKEIYGEAWLIQVSVPHVSVIEVSGFDIGVPSGGFSAIESELITEGLPGPQLNKWGLIQTLPEALAYFEARKANERLEQMKEIMIVGVTVLSETSSEQRRDYETDPGFDF